MKRIMIREIVIFGMLMLFLALGMHFSQWMDHPLQHLQAVGSSSLGTWHPLWITAAVYLLLLMLRAIVKFLAGLFSAKN